MWQEIITFLIIIAAIAYSVYKIIKDFRNGGGDCEVILIV
ncbi:MAG: FeoB-associated Cys-rich membrane protein [Bacteroidales bacterium]|nr:FeoB-associated Cys-rich membrane protein [Bacteroidales bacterium]